MAKDKTNIAVIGAGRIALMHARIIRQTSGAMLAGVVDRQKRYAQLKSAGLDGAKLYANADDAFADDEVDAVLIASSTPTHCAFIIAAAQAGKDVLCEKPVAFDAAAIDAVAEETSNSGRVIRVGFNRRFDDDFAMMRARLQSGEVGDAVLIHITNHDPQCPPAEFAKTAGGMFADFNVHDFDMLHFLTGAKIASIHARGGAKVCAQAIKDGAKGEIDTTLISMELTNGVFASIHCCRQSCRGYDQRAEILGKKGMLFVHNHRDNAIAIANNNGETIANPPPNFAARYRNSYQSQLRAFLNICQNNNTTANGVNNATSNAATSGDENLTTPNTATLPNAETLATFGDESLATLTDAAEAIKIAQAAQQSLQTGKTISVNS